MKLGLLSLKDYLALYYRSTISLESYIPFKIGEASILHMGSCQWAFSGVSKVRLTISSRLEQTLSLLSIAKIKH